MDYKITFYVIRRYSRNKIACRTNYSARLRGHVVQEDYTSVKLLERKREECFNMFKRGSYILRRAR